MKRILAFVASVLCASSAHATPTPTPSSVFGEVAVAPIDHEIAAWNAALQGLGASPAPFEHDKIVTSIGKALDFPLPDGVDLRRPLSVLVTDPRGRAHPFVLTVEVSDEGKFAAATQGLPTGIGVRRSKRIAIMGDPALLQSVGDYAFSRLRDAPKDGARARVFFAPLWAAFGAQAAMLRALLVGQKPSGATAGLPPETMLQMFDAVVSGVQQVRELVIDARAGSDGVEGSFHLVALAGTNVDHFIAQQKPSDFSMLAQMADLPFSYLAAGHLDMTSERGFSDWIFGPPKSDEDRARRNECMKLSTGEMVFSNQIITPTQMALRFLLRAPADVTPTKALVSAMFNAMSGSAMLGGNSKMSTKPKPASTYDGLEINREDVDLDMGKLATTPETAHIKQARAWTMWGNMIASATGEHADAALSAVIDAARHGTKTWTPSASQHRALDSARAAKESFVFFFDPKAMDAFKTDKTGPQLKMGALTGFFGFGNHQGWMRFKVSGAR